MEIHRGRIASLTQDARASKEAVEGGRGERKVATLGF